MRTGTWNGSPFPNSLNPGSAGADITCMVSGQYIGFVFGTNTFSDATITVVIDGVTILNGAVFAKTLTSGTYDGTYRTYIYDTGVDISHTLAITFSTAGVNTLPYMFGFNYGDLTRNVLAVSPDNFDYTHAGSGGWNGGSPARLTLMKDIQRTSCHQLREMYGAQTYFVDASTNIIVGSRLTDQVHPNANGHKYIRDRILYVARNGEY
jgi:hypothetical protein